jgi:hypothetical protein
MVGSRLSITPRAPLQRNSGRPRNFSAKRVEEPSFFESSLAWYSRQLDTNPIITKGVSAGLISGLGNVLAQRLIHKGDGKFQVDWQQTGRYALLNVVFVAPVLHYWYAGLARAVPGREIAPVLKRVFYDEFVFTPLYVPALMGLLWSMEGVDLKHIPRMIREEWLTIMLFDWAVYIPVQFVNFRYVPVKFQVLVISLIGVGWNVFVSWRAQGQQVAHKELKDKEANAEKTD